MDCKTCKENRAANVPFIVHEAAEARAERHIKRLVVSLILAVVLLFASNALWLYCWIQYDYSSEEYTVDMDAGGIATYVGEDGDINYGTYPGSEAETDEDSAQEIDDGIHEQSDNLPD